MNDSWGSSNAENETGMGLTQNRLICDVTAMVRELYQIIFLISTIGGWVCLNIQLILKTNKLNNVKDTALLYLFLVLVWKQFLFLELWERVTADGHVFCWNQGAVPLVLLPSSYIIDKCLLSGQKILKSEKSFSSNARAILMKGKKHCSSPIYCVRWEMFSWIQECNKRKVSSSFRYL